MGKQFIVAIGREYGSAGHEVGERLAKKLGVKFYDRSLLEHLAENKDMDVEILEKFDEQVSKPFIHRHVRGYSNSIEENVAQMQFEFIREKADEGESFVIVGRCAEEVLRGRKELISIFVMADEETKIKRVKEKYNLSEEDAKAKMKRHDTNRKKYHNTHSSFKWGDSRGYDLCFNSSRLGVDMTVNSLERYVNERIEAFEN